MYPGGLMYPGVLMYPGGLNPILKIIMVKPGAPTQESFIYSTF